MPAAINVDYLGRVNVSITFLMFFYDNKVSFGTITRFDVTQLSFLLGFFLVEGVVWAS